MSYDLHIEREDVFDPITREQWIDHVATDPELTFAPGGRTEMALPNGGTFDYRNNGWAFWTAHPRQGADGRYAPPPEGVLFHYHDGGLHVARPDDPIIGKMCRIADVLGAYVEGDGGERYAADDYP